VTVQAFADALCIALAKRGARVKVRDSHSSSVYLLAKYRDLTHSIRVSDHPPGKRWKSGLNATNVQTNTLWKPEGPEVVAVSVMGYLKDGV